MDIGKNLISDENKGYILWIHIYFEYLKCFIERNLNWNSENLQ